MPHIGRYNSLKIKSVLPNYCLLDGGHLGDIALQEAGPNKAGDVINAFIYLDSEGKLVASTKKQLAEVGTVAWLKVVSINDTGAFLDWGLPKDLLLPFSEQRYELKEGSHCLVKIYIDNSNRIAATTRLDKHLLEQAKNYQPGQQVSLVIAEKTELGFKAVVDHQYWGLLYDNEIYQPLKKGQHISGYIKRVRQDGKLDLSLQQAGYGKIDEVTEKILEKLRQNNGHMLISDKSSPEAIKAVFGISKKVFKQAIGALYKKRIITIETSGIKINEKLPPA